MRAGKLFPAFDTIAANRASLFKPFPKFRVQSTGEFRIPQAGEWFISGSIPEGYYAQNTLLSPYNIGRLVRVHVTTTTRVHVTATTTVEVIE